MTNWTVKKFDMLSPQELYALLRLRSEVFVVEQQCIFLDMDDRDQQSFHLMGWAGEKLVAYTRLVPPGVIYEEPSIGRVVTSPAGRGKGTGRELMQVSVREAIKLFGHLPLRIGAQIYLEKFYAGLGFRQVSDTYIEDGILHIEMMLDTTPAG